MEYKNFIYSIWLAATFFVVLAMRLPAQSTIPGLIPRINESGGTIYHCLFDPRFDAMDGDGWPDHWQRKHGVDSGILFPDHLNIQIAVHRNPFSNYVLRMEMQGGGAAVFTPKIEIRPGMSYTTSVYVFAEKLDFDNISMLLSFYGKDSPKPLKTVSSEMIRNTGGWKKIEIGPVIADRPDIKSVSIGLFVLPEKRQDFGSVVDFTNLVLRESPTISLSTNNRDHLFLDPRNIDVSCEFNGVDPDQRTVQFVLEDPFGRSIASKEVEMTINGRPASQFVQQPESGEQVLHGSAVWQTLPITSPGFYRVGVRTPKAYSDRLELPEGVFFRDPLLDTKSLNLVITKRTGFIPQGEFGWNLDGWTREEIGHRSDLLTQAGLSQLKIPAWLPKNIKKEDRKTFIDLCNELTIRQANVIGLLSPIPEDIRQQIKRGPVNAAAVFSLDPKNWMSDLQPTLEELSLIVRDWQWTADEDLSLSGFPGFLDRFDEFRKQFDPYDYGYGVGLGWDWMRQLPERFSKATRTVDLSGLEKTAMDNSPTIDPANQILLPQKINEFVVLNSDESTTADDLEYYFANDTQTRIRRFVSLTPLPRSEYNLQDRLIDLIRRMVLGKVGGAEALFLTRPKDSQRGVLTPEGIPNELFLPWKTTASMLSGRQFIGSINMPKQSRNFNFLIEGSNGLPDEVVTVLWNDRVRPDVFITETLHLGAEPHIVDIWGKQYPAELRNREQNLSVGRVPVFVAGVDPDITRIRIDFRLETTEMPSQTGRANTIWFSMTNTTRFPITAQIFVRPPRPNDWVVTRPEPLTLEPGQTGRGSFELTLNRSANTGLIPIRFDLKLSGSRILDFAVYDTIQIGKKDVSMEFSSRINQNGDLEVYQSFINNGDEIFSYEFRLYVPHCPVEKSKIVNQGTGRVEHVYTIPKGRELIRREVSEMVLKADPIGEGQPMTYTIPLLPE